MTEAVEQAAISSSPLNEVHESAGAIMCNRDGWSVPANYGDTLLEYGSVRENGAGMIDLSSRGRLIVGGSEAVQFLNGLITNDMKTLVQGHWMPAAFPNVQGRLVASVRVIRLKDEPAGQPVFLIDTEPATHDRVLKSIERFTLAGDFRVTDVTNQTAHISLQGNKAGTILKGLLGGEQPGLLQAQQIDWSRNNGSVQVTILRATHTSADGFDLILPAGDAAGLWEALVVAGARPAGYDALEILRIEAGLPRYGVDVDETNVVTEALDDAVSYTKGCYVGQEIIARIKYRGHVARKMSGIVFGRSVKVETGAVVKSAEDKEIGRLTSTTYSPHLGCTIAMGYLKYDYIAPKTAVKIAAGEQQLLAEVAELPFVRQSPAK